MRIRAALRDIDGLNWSAVKTVLGDHGAGLIIDMVENAHPKVPVFVVSCCVLNMCLFR